MSDDTNRAYAAAEEAAGAGSARMLGTVLERLGASSGARAVFGKPVEQDGRTVIPVAQSIIGIGGGGGGSEASGIGQGAGGGARTSPLGYIEVSADGTAFVPLKRPWQEPALVLAYAVLALVVLRAAVRLIRG